jgi:hypothetical protein
MNNRVKSSYTPILYVLCLYDVYLYLPDVFDLFKLDIEPPTTDYLLYFDAAMLLVGGIVIGIMLMKAGGKFNKALGVVMILMNVVFTPWFILRGLPG